MLAVTDSPVSPIAQLARHVLLFRAGGPSFFNTMVGPLALVEDILARLALSGGPSVVQRLRRTDAMMREAGGGSIINLSSLAGMRGIPWHAIYGTSKWAIRGLTKTAAYDLGPSGIRVNAILPGAIEETGMAGGPLDERQVAGRPVRPASDRGVKGAR